MLPTAFWRLSLFSKFRRDRRLKTHHVSHREGEQDACGLGGQPGGLVDGYHQIVFLIPGRQDRDNFFFRLKCKAKQLLTIFVAYPAGVENCTASGALRPRRVHDGIGITPVDNDQVRS